MLLHEFSFLIVGRLRRADGLGGVEPAVPMPGTGYGVSQFSQWRSSSGSPAISAATQSTNVTSLTSIS
jgi:hypothetical protein